MNATFKKMTQSIDDLKTKLAALDGRRADFADQHRKATEERDRLEKELVKQAVGGNLLDRREIESAFSTAENNVKHLTAVLSGFSAERGRLQAELEQAQRALGDWLTGESGSFFKRELGAYQKAVKGLQESIGRLMAGNHLLAAHGGSVATIYTKLGPQWNGIFTPALTEIEGGKAVKIKLGPDAATMKAVQKELLG